MSRGDVAPGALSRLRRLSHELGKFGAVGLAAYVVDIGIYNLIRFGLDWAPLRSKAISTIIAITVAYFGNRHWTWRHRRHTSFRREYLLFAIVNGAGLAIQLAILGFTVYVLDLRGGLAENLAGNVVGVAIGTGFRFWAYRTWVFPHHPPDELPPDDPLDSTTITPY
jgi:putative flippase GtrA